MTGIDAGQPVVVLSGIHVGCWELFGGSRVRTIRDLKGKRVPIAATGAEEHLLTSSMLAYLGMDPRKDVEFVTIPLFDDQIKAFVAGDVDAMFALPPAAPEAARREDRARNRRCGPRQALVAILLLRGRCQSGLCDAQSDRHEAGAARHPQGCRHLCARAAAGSAIPCHKWLRATLRDCAGTCLSNLPYGRWRDFNPEDTLRFHALRLHEVGMIKTNPNKLIAQGTGRLIGNKSHIGTDYGASGAS